MRLLIAVLCIGLSACAGSIEQLASTDPGGDQQANPPEQGEKCAKLGELRIGMTTSQVLSACGRRPLRTSDLITRDGKKLTVWTYGKSYLHLSNDQLVQIIPIEQN
jgi:hypothetical protein